MEKMLDKLNEYINNATPDQLKEDWEELGPLCDIGVPVPDFLPDMSSNEDNE